MRQDATKSSYMANLKPDDQRVADGGTIINSWDMNIDNFFDQQDNEELSDEYPSDQLSWDQDLSIVDPEIAQLIQKEKD